MALQPRLDLRQTQSLVMTPQLQQAIKLLQLSNLELTIFVEQELERNPLLERVEAVEDFTDPVPVEERRDADSLLIDPVERSEGEAPLDIEIDNSFDEGSPFEGPSYDPESAAWSSLGSGGGSGSGGDGEGRSFEETMTRVPTLRQHLVEQLDLEFSDPGDRMIGTALIDGLDEAGRLILDVKGLAEDIEVPTERIEAVLGRMKGFDPTGIFARDLAECLALQLQEQDRYDPAMAALVEHLDLLARRDFAALRDVCGVSGEDLQDMVAELRRLDPKPAQSFEGTVAEPVIPDVLMRSNPDGGWIVELNPESLPHVLVNNRYFAVVNQASLSKDEKTFLTESFQTASWLVKSLDQRAHTILKVSTEIVRQQHGFFERGVSGLRPLILRDIAEVIDMHESTVSRVTNNKYIATPRGIFELKYFFTQAIGSSEGGDSHSAEAVRYRIKALIDAEEASAVLSDDTLVDLLRAEGIEIARRTVAKYREAMRIPSSVQRRREKGLQAQRT